MSALYTTSNNPVSAIGKSSIITLPDTSISTTVRNSVPHNGIDFSNDRPLAFRSPNDLAGFGNVFQASSNLPTEREIPFDYNQKQYTVGRGSLHHVPQARVRPLSIEDKLDLLLSNVAENRRDIAQLHSKIDYILEIVGYNRFQYVPVNSTGSIIGGDGTNQVDETCNNSSSTLEHITPLDIPKGMCIHNEKLYKKKYVKAKNRYEMGKGIVLAIFSGADIENKSLRGYSRGKIKLEK